MTQTTPGVKGYRHKGRFSRLLRPWQCIVLGFYVALFALVLPLICWGALAEPGHPHRLPHFVFADPVLTVPDGHAARSGQPANATATQPALLRHGAQHGPQPVAVQQARVLAVCSALADGVIPGRATPTLMVFSLLLLLFLAAWTIRPHDLLHFATWQRLHTPQARFLPVPLPPPRLLQACLCH